MNERDKGKRRGDSRMRGSGGNNGGNATGRRARRATELSTRSANYRYSNGPRPRTRVTVPALRDAVRGRTMADGRATDVPGWENPRPGTIPKSQDAEIERTSMAISRGRSAWVKTVKPAGRTRSDLDGRGQSGTATS